MDVHFLHTGEPVIVVSDGQGEPGEFVTDGTGRKVWQPNGDYRPSRVVRLGAVEEVEPGQIAGTSYDDTATAARDAAIESGDHPSTEGVQFVHEAAAAPTAGPIGAGGTDGGTAGGGAFAAPGATGAETAPEQTALNDAERAELEQYRAAAGGTATDNADVAGRSTVEDTTTT